MKLFRRKPPSESPKDRYWFVTHIPSRDLRHAQGFAMMLTNDRGSTILEIPDVVAGMYIYQAEKIVQFWPHLEALEEFVETHCGMNRERWLYWFEYCEQFFRAAKGIWIGRQHFYWTTKRSFYWKSFSRSPNLEAVYQEAERLSTVRETQHEKSLPVLAPATLLLSIARQPSLEFGRKLIESGLDLQKLEQEVQSPRRPPRL